MVGADTAIQLSPGKSTLQRNNATAARQHHNRAISMGVPRLPVLQFPDASGLVPAGAAAEAGQAKMRDVGSMKMSPSKDGGPSLGNSKAAGGKENQPLSKRYADKPLPFAGPREPSSSSPFKSSADDESEERGRKMSQQDKHNTSKGVAPRPRSVSPTKMFRLRTRSKSVKESSEDAEDMVERSPREIDNEFVAMLAEMQVPANLMSKLIGLEPRVKQSMMKGQAALTLSALTAASLSKVRPALSDAFMRSKSSLSVDHQDEDLLPPTRLSQSEKIGAMHPSNSSSSGNSSSASFNAGSKKLLKHNNASSASLATSFRSRSASMSGIGPGSASLLSSTSSGATASSFAVMLKANDTSRLEVAKIKKMRAVLSSESPTWLTTFFEEGGYQAMLVRLQELLDMEWREEQHDDQLLHELLRCFVALTSTECGRQTLAMHSPKPFRELSTLLFSEKRPGDLSTRKLLVELLCIQVDLPSVAGSIAIAEMNETRNTRVNSSVLSMLLEKTDSTPHFAQLFMLLHNPRDAGQEALVDFISASHTPRPFKALVTELFNINRDYFWVFCHSQNRFWSLQSIDVDQAQGPQVPGGMTGGVEFEAMSYLTAHMRMLNIVAKNLAKIERRNGLRGLAQEFHALLFASGFERTLSITRKASQNYYQALHLELARYFEFARKSGFRLPPEIEVWQSDPQMLPSHASTASTPAMTMRSGMGQEHTRTISDAPQLPPFNLGQPLPNPHKPVPADRANKASSSSQPSTPKSTKAPSPSQSAMQQQATLVGNAVRRWEQRVAVEGGNDWSFGGEASAKTGHKPQQQQQQHDSSFTWTPPKEWS